MRKLHPEFEANLTLDGLEYYYAGNVPEEHMADRYYTEYKNNRLFADQDLDVQKATAEPEEEPRVVKETHQLPRGFRLETEWLQDHPEPCVNFEWWGPRGMPHMEEDDTEDEPIIDWYEDVPSGNGDDARDLIRSVVAKYTEILGD